MWKPTKHTQESSLLLNYKGFYFSLQYESFFLKCLTKWFRIRTKRLVIIVFKMTPWNCYHNRPLEAKRSSGLRSPNWWAKTRWDMLDKIQIWGLCLTCLSASIAHQFGDFCTTWSLSCKRPIHHVLRVTDTVWITFTDKSQTFDSTYFKVLLLCKYPRFLAIETLFLLNYYYWVEVWRHVSPRQ